MTSGIFVILILVGTLAVTGAILFGVYRAFGKPAEAKSNLLQTGYDANGQVVSLTPTGSSIAFGGHRHVGVQIQMMVQVQGRPPYQAATTAHISEFQIPQIQPGQWIPIKVDPQNPQSFALAGPFAQATANIAPKMKSAMMMAGIMTVVISVVVAIPLLGAFVDWSAFGSGSDDDAASPASGEEGGTKSGGVPKGGYCKGLVACCKAASMGNDASCDKWSSLPAAGCKSAYQSYKKAAEAQGKTCP